MAAKKVSRWTFEYRMWRANQPLLQNGRERRKLYLLVKIGKRKIRMLRTRLLSEIRWIPTRLAQTLFRIGCKTFDHLIAYMGVRAIDAYRELNDYKTHAKELDQENRKKHVRHHGAVFYLHNDPIPYRYFLNAA